MFSKWTLERERRITQRYWVLVAYGMHPLDAHGVSQILEYRCISHERLGEPVTCEPHDYQPEDALRAHLLQAVLCHAGRIAP